MTLLEEHELVALSNIERALSVFGEETLQVFEALVLPNWGKRLHGMKHMLYGGMMMSFAYIDLLSTFWNGTAKGGSQNPRMVNFMVRYLHHDSEAALIAVKVWRHKLMHTARPRPLEVEETGTRYHWLLHWGPPHLPREQHFTFNNSPDKRILGTGLLYLIKEVQEGFVEYRDELFGNPDLVARFRAGREEIKLEIVKQVQA